MTQKLSDLIRFTGRQFPRIKTRVEALREAAQRAARTRKRMKAQRLREAAASKAQEAKVAA